MVVAGGAALLGVEERILPGRSALHRELGLDGPAGIIPTTTPGASIEGSFVSRARRHTEVGWKVSYPPGATPGAALPVLVVLHGAGGSHASAFGHQLGLDRFQAAGEAPFAIASIDGGTTYWHRRANGEDAGAMVTDEFLPLLKQRGLDTDRLALLGWSMGGYGALLLGETLRPRAIAAESVAIWPTAKQAAPVAFDNATDFATHTIFGRQRELDGIFVRIDCGDGDGFAPNDRAYRAGFATPPAGGIEPGGHNMAYWRRMAPDQLAFIAQHLST
ncbi:alpha/beta hydrolase [soil metagenome]